MAAEGTTGTAGVAMGPGSFWIRLVAGLVVVWALFQAIAFALGSVRGERGLLVGAAVVAALLAVEWTLFRVPPRRAAAALGLGWPRDSWGLVLAVALAGLLLAYFPIFSMATGNPLRPVAGWPWLALAVLPRAG